MKKRVLVVGPSVPRRLTDDPSISVIHCPLIDLRPLPVDIAALKQIAAIRHVIITSKHAATFFHDALMQAAIDYTPQKAFCVGHETAECVRTIFPTADIQTASVATQEGVVDLVLSHHPDHALWPRSSQARRHLPESLEKNGISVTELVLYAPVASSTPCSLDTVNIVFFTCPSSVDAFFDRFGQKLPATLSFQSIGPVTETRLVKYTQTC